MKKLETVENRVLAVLKEHPEARNDDMKLYLLISKACIYDERGHRDVYGRTGAFSETGKGFASFPLPS